MSCIVKIADNVLSPLGTGTAANYSAAKAGASAIRVHEGAFGLQEAFTASLFDRKAIFEDAAFYGIEGHSFFDTLMLLSAARAFEKSAVDPSSPRVAFVLSSIKGNVDALGKRDGSVPVSASAVLLASHFGNPNPVLAVSNACISGLSAIIHARRMLLQDERYDYVAVVGAECQSAFIVSGFNCLKALSAQPCKPFDRNRNGLNLGEGAATIVLGRKDSPREDDWCLLSGAVRNDANHISGPSREGEGSFNALRCVLADCALRDLAFVNVHGTATLYNDEMEAIALSRAGLSDIPVNALKGTFGHTMGAAGILETLLSMKAVEDGTVLPTKGFSELGVTHPVNVSASPRQASGKSFIKLLSGFGGCNAAMLFRLGGPGL